MTSTLKNLQQRAAARKEAHKNINTSFIFDGYPSIKIEGTSGSIQASVVNKQERDIAYVYTQLSDSLNIGSIWTAKTLHLMIAEEIAIIKDVNWHKYKSFICNVELDNTWGYFIGPEKSYINVTLLEKAVYQSQQKPILVMPYTNLMPLNFMDKIVIKGRPWLVQEYDAISANGLVYYSLVPTTIDKETLENNADKENFIKPYQPEVLPQVEPIEEIEDNIILIKNNQNITLNTKDGFVNYSNKNIKIVKRTRNEIVFLLPNGVIETSITVKDAEDNLITKNYKAVV